MDVRTLCHENDAILFINEEIALAKMLDCPVHLKSTQLMTSDIAIVLAGHPFAASCHRIDELLRAEKLSASFAVLGPVLETASHPGEAGMGWSTFARMRSEVSLPIFALGGLGKEDVINARTHGAQGIAAISQLWPARL